MTADGGPCGYTRAAASNLLASLIMFTLHVCRILGGYQVFCGAVLFDYCLPTTGRFAANGGTPEDMSTYWVYPVSRV